MTARPSFRVRVPGGEAAGLVLVLLLLVGLFGAASDHFLSRVTLVTIANQVPALTLASVGLTLVLIGGGIDLAVGSVMALAAAVLGLALTAGGLPWPIAALASVAVGVAAGALNGLVIVRWTVPSFIVTLGMLEAARGGAYLVTDSRSVFVGGALDVIGAPVPWLGLSPAFLLAVAIVVAAQVVLTRTVFGRYLTAVGTNREAVRLAGIDPRPIEVAVFTISGALAGLAGVCHVAYLESVDPNAGIGLELSAIAAVVIGGTSLLGGRGAVTSSFLGVLIIAVLQAGLAQVGASEPVKRLVTGAVIVVAVVLDAYRRRFARA